MIPISTQVEDRFNSDRKKGKVPNSKVSNSVNAAKHVRGTPGRSGCNIKVNLRGSSQEMKNLAQAGFDVI